MKIREIVATLNRMRAEGVISRYAIGGAVGATFYLEPIATLDVDVFVPIERLPGRQIATLAPIYYCLKARGCRKPSLLGPASPSAGKTTSGSSGTTKFESRIAENRGE